MQDKRNLIVGTIADLANSIAELDIRLETLTSDLVAKRERLAAWRRELAEIDGIPNLVVRRQPKGANLRTIVACLDTQPVGLTAAQIRDHTKIAWSSVQRVLSGNKNVFIQINGTWRLANAEGREHAGEQVGNTNRGG